MREVNLKSKLFYSHVSLKNWLLDVDDCEFSPFATNISFFMIKTLMTSLEHLLGDDMSTAQLSPQNIYCIEDRHFGMRHKHS